MKRVEQLFREYEAFHKDPRNKLTHYFGIPMIVFAIVALLALVPLATTSWGVVDLSMPLIAAVVVFYAALDVALGIGSLAFFAAMVAGARALLMPWWACVGLFVLGWILQFIGHHFEGKKPAFLTNFVHLLVGPLWILSHLYEKLGLRQRPAAIASVLLAVILVAPGAVQAQDRETDEPTLLPQTRVARDLMQKGDDALKAKKWDEAVAAYRDLLAHLEKSKAEFRDFPESQQKAVRIHAHYNAACAHALAGRRDKAIEELKAAVEAGWFDWQHLEKDEDLASIRGDEGYKQVVQSLRGQDKDARKLAEFVGEALSPAPLFDFDFEVTTLEKEKLKLSDLRGKVVIVDCFGTWCPPCKEEIPHFVKLVEQAKERGEPLVVIGLAWERADPTDAIEKDVRDFLAERKVTYAVALMKQKDPILDRIPDLRAFPTTLWVDKAGKVRGRIERLCSFEELNAVTQALLDEGKPAAPKKSDKAETPGEKKPAPEAPKKKPHEDEPF